MPNVYIVRAEGGLYADAFRSGGYMALGWHELRDLSKVKDLEEFAALYKKTYPEVTSNHSVAQQCGQIWRFIYEISKDDYVITPTADSARLAYGQVVGDYYFKEGGDSSCSSPHRREVKWSKKEALRYKLPIPVQYTIRATLTVFQLRDTVAFFEEIGRDDLVSKPKKIEKASYYEAVIDRILELDATEFEQLLMDLLVSIGFDAEHTGGSGDGGIDVEGNLDVYGLASMDLKVQAKRFKKGSTISDQQIKNFRGSLPEKSQGAFITTSAYTKKALEEAVKPGFKKIGVISGEQLVDILVEKYDYLSQEIKDKLNLKKVLVPE